MSDELTRQVECQPLAWSAWHQELMIELGKMRPGRSGGGVVIPAWVPYRLGWTPHKTARALVNVGSSEHRDLVDEMKKEGLNKGLK